MQFNKRTYGMFTTPRWRDNTDKYDQKFLAIKWSTREQRWKYVDVLTGEVTSSISEPTFEKHKSAFIRINDKNTKNIKSTNKEQNMATLGTKPKGLNSKLNKLKDSELLEDYVYVKCEVALSNSAKVYYVKAPKHLEDSVVGALLTTAARTLTGPVVTVDTSLIGVAVIDPNTATKDSVEAKKAMNPSDDNYLIHEVIGVLPVDDIMLGRTDTATLKLQQEYVQLVEQELQDKHGLTVKQAKKLKRPSAAVTTLLNQLKLK